MAKRKYNSVINNVIKIHEDKLIGMNKKDSIQMIYNYIIENNLVTDFSEISLQNTIYYFLRKSNQFTDIKYKLDSVKSKIDFLITLKEDIRNRKNHYIDILLKNNVSGYFNVGEVKPQQFVLGINR